LLLSLSFAAIPTTDPTSTNYTNITTANWNETWVSEIFRECQLKYPDTESIISSELIKSTEYRKEKDIDPEETDMWTIPPRESKTNKDLEDLKISAYFSNNISRYFPLVLSAVMAVGLTIILFVSFFLRFFYWRMSDITMITERMPNGEMETHPTVSDKHSLRLVGLLIVTCSSLGCVGILYFMPARFIKFGDELHWIYCANFQ
jgi:hypothetical protein